MDGIHVIGNWAPLSGFATVCVSETIGLLERDWLYTLVHFIGNCVPLFCFATVCNGNSNGVLNWEMLCTMAHLTSNCVLEYFVYV